MSILETNLMTGKRALLIEPEDEARRAILLLLQGWRFEVRAFSSAAAALADAASAEAHVLLVAHALSDADAASVIERLRSRGWHGRAILIVGERSVAAAEAAHQAGFGAILGKPVGRFELLDALVK